MSTMMPFLYQTRTLLGLRWARGATGVAIRNPSTQNRREFHRSPRHLDEESFHPDQRRASSRDPEPAQGQFRHDSSEERVFKGVRFFPANDDGRKQVHRGPFKIRRLDSEISDGDRSHEHVDGIPFDSSEVEDWEYMPTHAPREIEELTKIPSEPRKARETTITVAERHTFQRIFSDIFARSQRSGADGTVAEKASDIPVPSDQRESAKSKLNEVLLRGMPRRSREDIKQAANQFPPALRAAAARSLGLSTETPSIEQEKEVMQVDPLEHLREPERERVESLMRSAKTDFELWEVMEKEVFSLVDKMGLQGQEEAKEAISKPKKKGKKGKKVSKIKKDSSIDDEEAESQRQEAERKNKEEQRHQLALLGPLYPSYLLLGMRLLDRSFAKPSPLTLTLLPKIKSMGLISHVLGASTALYNELLRIYWFQHDNFTGVLELLNEMEEAGLDHDAETLEIITDISKLQMRVQRGERGATLRTLWSLPEYAPNEFEIWRQKIQSSMAESGRDFGQLTT